MSSVSAGAEFRAGLRDITPLSLGVALYGLAFGLMAAQIGMGAPLTALDRGARSSPVHRRSSRPSVWPRAPGWRWRSWRGWR